MVVALALVEDAHVVLAALAHGAERGVAGASAGVIDDALGPGLAVVGGLAQGHGVALTGVGVGEDEGVADAEHGGLAEVAGLAEGRGLDLLPGLPQVGGAGGDAGLGAAALAGVQQQGAVGELDDGALGAAEGRGLGGGPGLAVVGGVDERAVVGGPAVVAPNLGGEDEGAVLQGDAGAGALEDAAPVGGVGVIQALGLGGDVARLRPGLALVVGVGHEELTALRGVDGAGLGLEDGVAGLGRAQGDDPDAVVGGVDEDGRVADAVAAGQPRIVDGRADGAPGVAAVLGRADADGDVRGEVAGMLVADVEDGHQRALRRHDDAGDAEVLRGAELAVGEAAVDDLLRGAGDDARHADALAVDAQGPADGGGVGELGVEAEGVLPLLDGDGEGGRVVLHARALRLPQREADHVAGVRAADVQAELLGLRVLRGGEGDRCDGDVLAALDGGRARGLDGDAGDGGLGAGGAEEQGKEECVLHGGSFRDC